MGMKVMHVEAGKIRAGIVRDLEVGWEGRISINGQPLPDESVAYLIRMGLSKTTADKVAEMHSEAAILRAVDEFVDRLVAGKPRKRGGHPPGRRFTSAEVKAAEMLSAALAPTVSRQADRDRIARDAIAAGKLPDDVDLPFTFDELMQAAIEVAEASQRGLAKLLG